LGLATVAISLFGVFRPAHAGPQEKNVTSPQKETAEKETAQYVGVDTCKTCHEDLYKKNFESTPHFETTLNDGHGCESCHGPGSAHVEGGGDVTKIISCSR
jgi:cytochrome c553